MKDDEAECVFSIIMSHDEKTCDLQLRSDIPISTSMLIDALIDLAEQLKDDDMPMSEIQ